MELYDVCVVGAGLAGSAAAKWLSLERDMKVCLVGPPEPTAEEWTGGGRKVFGAHYDEGRITREYDKDYVWALLAQRSIQEYRSIEQESGIHFYNEVGNIAVHMESPDVMQNIMKVVGMLGIEHEIYSYRDFQNKYPYLRVGDDNHTYQWTPRNSGHINPRNLVAAQQKVAHTNGCKLIKDVVIKVSEEDLASSRDHNLDTKVTVMKVLTQGRREIFARRVLLCPGAFANFYDLLPGGLVLDITLNKYVMARAEVTKADVRMMSAMPTFLLPNKMGAVMPPIKYPDGNYYIKVGTWIKDGNEASDLEDAVQWYQRRGRYVRADDETLVLMRKILPDVKPVSLTVDTCILTLTPTGYPYCDMVTPRLGILTGMNGLGAKSSNELGRMGARMIARGRWDYDLPAELFKLRFKKTLSNTSISSKL